MKIIEVSALVVPLATILISDANAARIMPSLCKSESTIEAAIYDAKITETLQNAFQEDADLAIPTIHANTNRQIVTLYGKVYTQDERRVAIRLAKSIEGVKAVRSKLRIQLQG